jgi:hypothetical protein
LSIGLGALALVGEFVSVTSRNPLSRSDCRPGSTSGWAGIVDMACASRESSCSLIVTPRMSASMCSTARPRLKKST